jgi:hypothetical protein
MINELEKDNPLSVVDPHQNDNMILQRYNKKVRSIG